VLRQNQYGATLSGPIKKDQTFWFGNYEGQRERGSPTSSSIILNNLTAITPPRLFTDCHGDQQFTARATTTTASCSSWTTKLGEKHGLAFRYNLLDSQTLGFLGRRRASPASTTARNNKTLISRSWSTETAMFRPNIVNEARFQWARRSSDFLSCSSSLT